MKIHLISSLREFNVDLAYLYQIESVIKDNGGLVLHNWYDGVKDRRSRNSVQEELLNWDEIVETNIRATKECDALIVEGSRFNYSQGFQTALALEHGKPVLNLYREDLPEYKEWPDKLFVSGIANPLFTSRAYKKEGDLQKIVTEFLDQHAQKTHELDMKLTLDAESFDKVVRISREEGKSQTSVIKDMVIKGLSTD